MQRARPLHVQAKQGYWGSNLQPPATWRPFNDACTFYKPVPASPTLDANSTTMVNILLNVGGVNPSGGNPNVIHMGMTQPGTPSNGSEYYKPTYFGNLASDQTVTYTVTAGSFINKTFKGPSGMVAAGGTDHHFSMIDVNGYLWSFWNAQINVVDGTHSNIVAHADNSPTLTCRVTSLYHIAHGGGSPAGTLPTVTSAPGAPSPATSGANNFSGATGASFQAYLSVIKATELQSGIIPRALFIAINGNSMSTSTAIAPGAGSEVGTNANGLREGMRLWLDVTDSFIDTSGFPIWKRAILRALKNYGAYIGDRTSPSAWAFHIEGGATYTAFGKTDLMSQVAARDGESVTSGSPPNAMYDVNLSTGVSWSTALKVITDR